MKKRWQIKISAPVSNTDLYHQERDLSSSVLTCNWPPANFRKSPSTRNKEQSAGVFSHRSKSNFSLFIDNVFKHVVKPRVYFHFMLSWLIDPLSAPCVIKVILSLIGCFLASQQYTTPSLLSLFYEILLRKLATYGIEQTKGHKVV